MVIRPVTLVVFLVYISIVLTLKAVSLLINWELWNHNYLLSKSEAYNVM